MDGWIKLWRKSKDCEIFLQDPTAWRVFEYLLMSADFKTGIYTSGRDRDSMYLRLKPTTFYQALIRLSRNWKCIDIKTDNKKSTITILKWKQYQQDNDSSNDNKMTTNRQQNDTKEEVKNKRNKEDNNNVETQRVYDLFVSLFNKNPNTYKLTDKRKLKIKSRLKDAGIEMLEEAITKTSKSKFHNGDNDRGWCADLDFIIRSYEQVERLSQLKSSTQEIINNNLDKFMEQV